MVGGPLRKDVGLTSYEFHEVKRFGAQEIEINDHNLFLELTVKAPEQDPSYQSWERYCQKKKLPYIIAEGLLKPEKKRAFLTYKAKVLGKTLEEIINGKTTMKGHKQYSIGVPEKVYGFFRSPVIQGRCGISGETESYSLHIGGSINE